MTDDTTIIAFRQPGSITDPLTEIARDGACRMLMAALKAEADGFVARFSEDLLADGRQRVVRHGAGPERVIQAGIGPIEVRRQKVRDRATGVPAEARVRFASNILPKWARRTKSLDALLPVLYLRGISTGDFQEALSAILGADAPNLSPGVIARLTAGWQEEYDRWQGRDLSARRYVYIWADGVYLQARMEPEAECILVIIGAPPEGRKELLGFQVGVRESAQSWRELRIDIKARGLTIAPEVAVGDGALGFWKAVDEVFPGTRHQRCWFHKISNVLNKFPKSMAPAVTSDLQDIHHAETKAAALVAITVFKEKYGAKFGPAVTCLTKDAEAMLPSGPDLRPASASGVGCGPDWRRVIAEQQKPTAPCRDGERPRQGDHRPASRGWGATGCRTLGQVLARPNTQNRQHQGKTSVAPDRVILVSEWTDANFIQ